MSVVGTESRTASIETLLRRAAIPATARPVVDLRTRRPVVSKIITRDAAEPMDAVTIARTLNVMAAKGQPAVPVVFEVPIGTLLDLPTVGNRCEHPMIVSVAADRLLDHPAESLRLVQRARELGWEVGLHGVGQSGTTLTAVALFEPSLITLAPAMVADPTSPLSLESLQTVTSFRHATGATVMAEMLDTPASLQAAESLGATIGRGRIMPQDGTALPAELDYTLDLFVSPRRPGQRMTPYQISTQRHQSQRAQQPLLDGISRTIERAARTSGQSSMLLTTFDHVRHLSPRVVQQYQDLAGCVELVMITASGLRRAPLPGVSCVDLPRYDSLRREWTVLLLSPTSSVLLAAREVRRLTKQGEREFDYVLSYDRDLVTHAARGLLTRLPKRVARPTRP